MKKLKGTSEHSQHSVDHPKTVYWALTFVAMIAVVLCFTAAVRSAVAFSPSPVN